MSQAKLLYDLQQLDDEIRTGRLRLGNVLRAQKEPQALVKARLEMEKITAEIATWQARHNAVALELGSLNDKARRSEQRLYSGNVTNPKELTDLQHEMEMLGRQRDDLETRVLEALLAIEDAQERLAAIQETLTEMTADWAQQSESLQLKQQELALQLNELDGNRAALVGHIDAKALNFYTRLARQKNGQAVAELQENKCLGCQVTVSSNTVKGAAEGGLITCENCGRLLYVPV